MRTLTVFFIFLSISMFSGRLQAQQSDSVQKKHARYISRTIGLDSVKSNKVALIQKEYKEALNIVLEDKDLSDEQKTTKVRELMTIKNKKLAAILSEEQYDKFVPTTEREKKKEVSHKKASK